MTEPSAKPRARRPRWVIDMVLAAAFFWTSATQADVMLPISCLIAAVMAVRLAVLGYGAIRHRYSAMATVAVGTLYVAAFVVSMQFTDVLLARSEAQGLVVVAAIEKHIADTGTPPTTLDALVPDYLPAVPRTSFGVFLNAPYWYDVRDGDYTFRFHYGHGYVSSYDPSKKAFYRHD